MELSKKDIRKAIIKKRDEIKENVKSEMDSQIFDTFIKSEFYKRASVIFAFVSFASEVDTKRLIQYAINDNKTICVPRVISRAEGFITYKINGLMDLEEGFYGILEPKLSCEIMNNEKIDFILMPGVAFDRIGGRIGYGGGFYDRYLAGLTRNIDKIALAYDMQIIDKIPMEVHDSHIDGIITEREVIIFK